MNWRMCIATSLLCTVVGNHRGAAQAPDNPFLAYVRQISASLSQLDSDETIRAWIVKTDLELADKKSQIEASVISQYPASMREAKLRERLTADYEPEVVAKINAFKTATSSVHCDQSVFAPSSRVVGLELGAPATTESAISQLQASRLGVQPSEVAVVFATVEYPDRTAKFMPSEAYQTERQRFNSKDAFSKLNPYEWHWIKSATARLVVSNRIPSASPEAKLRENAYGMRSGFSLSDCTFVDIAVHSVASGETSQPPRTFSGPTIQATVVQKVAPVYPVAALRARVAGQVLVEVTVLADGSVGDTRIVRSIPLLDEAAINAVRLWRFRPGTRDGQPSESKLVVTVPFQFQ